MEEIDDVKEIFLGLGYEIADGPDIEKTYYVFDQLNTEKLNFVLAQISDMYLVHNRS